MGTKCPMFRNLSRLIEPHNSHRPFALSCATTNLFSTPSSMQTTNHPLVTPPIIINHIPPISSPYQPLTLHVNVGPQLYILSNLFNHAHIGHFPLPILLVLIVGHDQTPQLTPIFSTHFQPPPKVFCPTCGR
jgi:hypothetical protein